MIQEFGVKFYDLDHYIITYGDDLFKLTMDNVIEELPCSKIYVAKESEAIFEEQDKDLIVPKLVVLEDTPDYSHNVEIVRRDNKHFFSPEIEE